MKLLIILLLTAGSFVCGVLAMSGQILMAAMIGVALAVCVVGLMLVMGRAAGAEAPQDITDAVAMALDKLEAADRKNLFKTERIRLISALSSVMIKNDFFDRYPADGSVNKAYEMISKHIVSDVNSATRWIDAYDYVLRPDRKYLAELVRETQALAAKLSELSDLCIRIDDSAGTDGPKDSSFADDLLASLTEMLGEDA